MPQATVPAITPGSNTSFASIKQIDAGVLNALPGALPLSCFTAGRTIFTAMPTSRRCSPLRATG